MAKGCNSSLFKNQVELLVLKTETFGAHKKSVDLDSCSLFKAEFYLNREVVCSRSATRSADFAESSLVFQQEPVRASILDLKTAQVSALRAVAVRVRPQVRAILVWSISRVLPSGRVAVHLEEVGLLQRSSYFVLLCDHVF